MVAYLPDEKVDEVTDREIRELLTLCFNKPQKVVNEHRRYIREPYAHRWIIRNRQGALVAHCGVIEKEVCARGGAFCIGGICEVCVHPDFRGKGHVRLMLKCIHAWLSEHDFAFAVLFGNPLVYISSGYVPVENLLHGDGHGGWKPAKAMIRELSANPWPSGEIRLPGPTF